MASTTFLDRVFGRAAWGALKARRTSFRRSIRRSKPGLSRWLRTRWSPQWTYWRPSTMDVVRYEFVAIFPVISKASSSTFDCIFLGAFAKNEVRFFKQRSPTWRNVFGSRGLTSSFRRWKRRTSLFRTSSWAARLAMRASATDFEGFVTPSKGIRPSMSTKFAPWRKKWSDEGDAPFKTSVDVLL